MIMASANLRFKATARALNYLEAFFISRDEMFALCKRHPETEKRIRSHANWMALRREIVLLAQQKKRADKVANKILGMDDVAMNVIDVKASAEEVNISADQSRIIDERTGEIIDMSAGDGSLSGANEVSAQLDILCGEMQDERKAAAHREAQSSRMYDATTTQIRTLQVAVFQLRDEAAAREAAAAQRELRLLQMIEAIAKGEKAPAALPVALSARGNAAEDRVQDGEFACAKDSPPANGRRKKKQNNVSRAAVPAPPGLSNDAALEKSPKRPLEA